MNASSSPAKSGEDEERTRRLELKGLAAVRHDGAEFVDLESYHRHYERTVARIVARLRAAGTRGEVRDDLGEVEAWAIVGMNVFLGLRYGVWDDEADTAEVARTANRLLRDGIAPKR